MRTSYTLPWCSPQRRQDIAPRCVWNPSRFSSALRPGAGWLCGSPVVSAVRGVRIRPGGRQRQTGQRAADHGKNSAPSTSPMPVRLVMIATSS